jgi:hypothetical protein
MDKLTKVLTKINAQADAIIEESGQRGTSGIASALLQDAYPSIASNHKSTKSALLAVWNSVVVKAPRKMSRTYERLFHALDETLNILYSNENTRESILTSFRAPFKQRATSDPNFDKNIYIQSTHILGVSQERALERKREYADKVKARNAARGGLAPIYIEQIYAVIDELILSNNPYELSLAVLLATGSRSVELYKVSTYEEMSEVYRIRVIGIAKDKGNNNLQNVVLVRNLVRLTGKQVVNAVHKIRTALRTENLDNQKISSKTNAALNKAFKKHIVPLFVQNAGDKADTDEFKAQVKTLTSHKARYIGGNASYQIYGKPKNIPETSYLQEQYGHLSGESTKSYLAIVVKYENESNSDGSPDLIPLENRIAELESAVEACCDDGPPADIRQELKPFENSRTMRETHASKVQKVVSALKLLAAKKIKMKQVELRAILHFSADVMTSGYQAYRALS